MSSPPFVELRNIHKVFPGVKALTDVSIAFHPGKTHVLVGENGAGKSTINKIIAGIYRPDGGSLLVNGQECDFTGPRMALERGISVIHQELSVIGDLSVAENIFLGREPKAVSGLIDRQTMHARTRELLDYICIHIDPARLVRRLSNGEKQMVEIARALSHNSSMVIMDEPTSLLSGAEVQTLFRVIANLKQAGVAIIYISHRMKENREIGDTVTILRDGCVVRTASFADIDDQTLITLMVGRQISQFYHRASVPENSPVVLSLHSVTRKKAFSDVSFELRRGEVLGVAGLVGAGRTEVLRAIFGADRYESGELEVFGQKCRFAHPGEAIAAGIGLIPEERREQGLLLEKDLKCNTSLASLFANSIRGFIDFAWEQATTLRYIAKLRTKTPSERALAKNLSGGNQQKVVIAKWLTAEVKILLMDEPTRGIDVNAKAEIYALMREFVENGGSILFVSSELPEILGVATRILVMREGRVATTMPATGATEEAIMRYASSAGDSMPSCSAPFTTPPAPIPTAT